ncbi:MAG: TlpA disulfide reductase family protein [Pseudomonadota bacterium]
MPADTIFANDHKFDLPKGFTWVEPRNPLPNVKLFTDDDIKVDFASYKNTILVINFWASWCLPCVREIPSLQKLDQHFNDKELKVMLVNSNIKWDEHERDFLTKKLGITDLLNVHDIDLKFLKTQHHQMILPLTIIVDKQLKIVGKHLGEYDWTNEKMLKLFNFLIHE